MLLKSFCYSHSFCDTASQRHYLDCRWHWRSGGNEGLAPLPPVNGVKPLCTHGVKGCPNGGLAFGGANPDCQQVLSAMPGRPSLAEMLEACSKVGTPQHVASIVRDELRREWEEQMKEQMKGHLEKQSKEKTLEEMLQQQKNEIMSEFHAAIKKSNPLGGQCYRCGVFGHMMKNCPQTNIQVQALKLQNPVCERCGKGRHTAREYRLAIPISQTAFRQD
uniref:Gag polyprotein n=1 Tax=Serinus canaria TaxID=9135 RepID=A0A8C9NWT1_SERCA